MDTAMKRLGVFAVVVAGGAVSAWIARGALNTFKAVVELQGKLLGEIPE